MPLWFNLHKTLGKTIQASYIVKRIQGYRTCSFVKVPCGLHLSHVAPMEALKIAHSSVYNAKSRIVKAYCIAQHRKRNRPFPSSLVPLFQSESKCETILMKMTLICTKMNPHAELIFIWKVLHLDSFWKEAQENSEITYFHQCEVKAVEKSKPTNQDGWNILLWTLNLNFNKIIVNNLQQPRDCTLQ